MTRTDLTRYAIRGVLGLAVLYAGVWLVKVAAVALAPEMGTP